MGGDDGANRVPLRSEPVLIVWQLLVQVVQELLVHNTFQYF